MNKDFDNLIKKINKSAKPIVNSVINTINNYQPVIKRFQDAINIFINDNTNKFFKQLDEFIQNAKSWQENQKQDVNRMAQYGWYPNWFTFRYKPEKNFTNIDDLMKEHFNDDWDKITDMTIDCCQNRKHILIEAFKLHKAKNYIASIPLFLSQTDGIFCEEINRFLFSGNRDGKKINEVLEQMISNGELQNNTFYADILLEPLKIKSKYSEKLKNYKKEDKLIAPNRHGIIHGDKDHLDYGTEINSLKSFSLLTFIAFALKKIFKKTK